MTGWRAYRMLAFHLYRWNQIKVIPLDSRVRNRMTFIDARRRTAMQLAHAALT